MKEKIEKIKLLLFEVEEILKNTTNNNFDRNFPFVKKLLKESQKYKSFLLANYSRDELMIFEPDLTNLTKQIKKTFDYIIENKKIELDNIKSQMRYTQNKRKLVNYIR
jgi:hypothetical protein